MVLVRLVKCFGGERRSELNLRKWISSFQDLVECKKIDGIGEGIKPT